MYHRELIDNCGPQRHFNSLYGIQTKEAKFSIEVVKRYHVFESCPDEESFGRKALDRPHVNEQPVISDVVKGI